MVILDSFYYSWDFHTPANQIAHGILAFRQELTVLLTFVFWTLARCYPNDKNLVLTRSTNYDNINSIIPTKANRVSAWATIKKRGFSSVPPKFMPNSKKDRFSFFTKMRAAINAVMQSFIKNEDKQHEKVLAVHTLLLISLALFSFGIKASLLATFLITTLVAFCAVLFYVFTYLSKLKYAENVVKITLVVIGLTALVFGYFRFIIIVAIYLAITYLKNEVVAAHATHPTNVTLFFRDFVTINEHFQTEFRLFNAIRLFTFPLAFVVMNSLVALFQGLIPETLFWDLKTFGSAVEILFGVLVLNLGLVLTIQLIIIWFCNMITGFKVVQTCALCGIAAGTIGGTALAAHAFCTTPGLQPPAFKAVYAYQRATLGFAATDGSAIGEGVAFKAMYPGQKVPLLPGDGKFIDAIKTREALDAGANHLITEKAHLAGKSAAEGAKSAIWGAKKL